MKKFINILKVLIDNITTLIAIFMGFFVFLSYKFQTEGEMLSYIICILTLIAGSMLIEKVFSILAIKKDIKKIKSKLIEEDVFMYCHTSNFWNEALNSAKKLFISGGSLYHVIPEKTGDLEKLLDQGCIIEVVVVKPFSHAAELLHKNVVKEIRSADSFSENTIQTLDFLLKYKKEYPRQIIVRLNDNVPAFGMFVVYNGTMPKTIQANLFSEKVAYDKRLAININESTEKNRFVYEYFCSQIDMLKNRLPEYSIVELEKIVKG